jgi:dienelactone hydrolase
VKSLQPSPIASITSALLYLVGVANPSVHAASAPEVTHVTLSAGQPELNWTVAASGEAFTVQSSDSLTDGVWLVPRVEHLWPIDQPAWRDARSPDAPVRFYRVLAVPPAERGRVLSSTLKQTLSTLQIGFLFNLAGIPLTPQYNVQLYKIVYETIDVNGGRTRASGALAVPVGVGQPLPLVSYQHGTLTRTNDAPSLMSLSGEVSVGVAFATTGYAAAVPDLLGLGDSPGLHPYHVSRAEASCCVDMLRAVRTLCATNGPALGDRLFLCGYSEGGHVTMSLLRDLEAYHTNEFQITAGAPMAGAYDLSGVTAADFLSGRVQPNPYYFAYLLAAYQDVYRFAPTLADLLRVPYHTNLPPLLQGGSTGDQIDAVMPLDPAQILKPEILAAVQANANHPLRQALRDNDVFDWRPRSPLRLYHCSGDQDVVYTNSQVALARFHALGATQVELVNTVPGADHGDCAFPSLLAAKTWFDTLR